MGQYSIVFLISFILACYAYKGYDGMKPSYENGYFPLSFLLGMRKYAFDVSITMKDGQEHKFALYADYPYADWEELFMAAAEPRLGKGTAIKTGRGQFQFRKDKQRIGISVDTIENIKMERKEIGYGK